MSAREMFKKLGYELIEDNKRYLRYLKKDSEYGSGAYIEFDLVNKKIRLYTKTPNYNNNPRYADFNEFQYSDVTIDIIISNYCEKPGNKTLYTDKYGDVYALNYIPKWL